MTAVSNRVFVPGIGRFGAWHGNLEGDGNVALSDLPARYRALVDPEIAGVVTPEVTIDAAGSGVVYFLRATVNAGVDADAANRLLAGTDCRVINLDDVEHLRSEVNIERVDVAGIISGTTYTSTAGAIGLAETDAADALAEMLTFTFSSADQVREVIVTVTPSWTSGQLCRVKVQGVSHA